MFLFSSVLTVVSSVSVFIAGLLALLRSSTTRQNRWFFTVTTFISVWIPINFVDNNVVKSYIPKITLKLDYAIALFILWAFLEFVNSFLPYTEQKKPRRDWGKILFLISLSINIVFAALTIDNLLISASISSGRVVIHYLSTFYFYIALILFYLLYAFSLLFYRGLHAERQQKRMFHFVIAGFILAAIPNLFTNIVFPLLISDHYIVKQLNIIGYLGFVTLVFFLYLAITTQRLFDIRSFVVRSLAYVLTFTISSLLYVIPAVLLTTVLLHAPIKPTTIAILVVITLIVAMLFQKVRNTFNRITNKVFFRDYYEPQDVLDKLSNLLVGSVDIDYLRTESALIIQAALKPRTLSYKLISDRGSADKELLNQLFNTDLNMVIYDELTRPKFEELEKSMRREDIALAIRLRTTHEDLGFMTLGHKESGAVYTEADKRLLRVIADEIAISFQNALRFQEIRNFNKTLQEKIDNATKQLRRANERLKTLDETKDDFISMASHQLRTPLTSVKGYISMVVEGDAGKITGNQRRLLDQAFTSSQRMVYLIADLLNVSRLKTGKFVIERTTTNLADVVKDEVDQLIETAESRHLELVYHKPEHFPIVSLDETKTRQVMMNFMDNAIYYTPSGGHVDIKLVDNPKDIQFTVTDNGIGVPKAEQHHLFSKFYRAGNARKARPDGTGLGLFMAKKVIIAQGGAVIFQTQEGKGSTFGFSFPKSKLSAVAETDKK